MSPRRRDDDTAAEEIQPEASTPQTTAGQTDFAEGDDAEDPRTFEHEAAQRVRDGELSAAQMPGGHGNVDPSNPDAQYPPGVVQRTVESAEERAGVDPASFVPDHNRTSGLVTTDASPDYETRSAE